jgi:hypothetical protein
MDVFAYDDGAAPPPESPTPDSESHVDFFNDVIVLDHLEIISEPPPKKFKYDTKNEDEKIYDSDSPDDTADKDYVFRSASRANQRFAEEEEEEEEDDEDATPTRRRRSRVRKLRKPKWIQFIQN